MHSLILASCATFFIGLSTAAPKKVQQPSVLGATTQCYTSWATTRFPSKYSTQWQTTTTSYTSTITVTDTSTTTPQPDTTTSILQTATTITEPTSTSVQTNIFVTTAIATNTTTSTDISTATEFVMSIPTVPAPSGFIPVQNIPGSAWDGLSGLPSRKRSLSEALKAILQPRSVARYKQGVICEVFVPETPAETAYVTVVSTQTAPQPTSTEFYTNTISSLIVPMAETTTTSTSTVTDFSVTTQVQSSTTTTTQIVGTATTSILAACATNNFMDSINGQSVDGWGPFADYTSSSFEYAYDCCQWAFTYPAAVANWNLRGGMCYLGINSDGQCSQATEMYPASYGSDQGVIGNGPCAQGLA